MLTRPIVYLITEGRLTASNFFETAPEILKTVRIAADSGITLIQVREKRLPAKLLLEITRMIADTVHGTRTKVVVNDRADIAAAAGAHGVHLTSGSVRPRDLRPVFPELIIGVSTHSEDEISAARDEGADFVVFGPVFATPGKGVPVGIDELARVCDEFRPFPIVGLGGLDRTNYGSALAVADGFAAIRFLNDAEELKGLKL